MPALICYNNRYIICIILSYSFDNNLCSVWKLSNWDNLHIIQCLYLKLNCITTFHFKNDLHCYYVFNNQISYKVYRFIDLWIHVIRITWSKTVYNGYSLHKSSLCILYDVLHLLQKQLIYWQLTFNWLYIFIYIYDFFIIIIIITCKHYIHFFFFRKYCE